MHAAARLASDHAMARKNHGTVGGLGGLSATPGRIENEPKYMQTGHEVGNRYHMRDFEPGMVNSDPFGGVRFLVRIHYVDFPSLTPSHGVDLRTEDRVQALVLVTLFQSH